MLNDYRAATEASALFDLSERAKIELAGRDAREFLTNLCTQDVKNLPVGETREAFLTTNKARVIAPIWITHRESNVLLLDLAAAQAEKTFKHLNHYLISEQVELADRTREYGMLRLVGPTAAELLTRTGIPPTRRHRLLALDGYDWICPASDVAPLRQRLLEAGAVLGGPAAYDILRIEAGLPEYGIDIDEDRLAMEVNRAAEAISYTKGCYLGQETIVMARDRGQVNRRMMGVKVQSEPERQRGALAPGTKFFRGNEEVGQVTSSVFSPRMQSVLALAYLRRGSWDAGTEIALAPDTTGAAVVCALPFLLIS